MKRDRYDRKFRGKVCLNCETNLDLSDRYCPNCGQLNSTKKLSFNDFFYEFFGSIFAYDSRLYRTLNVLIFRPGRISTEYIQGKRARYANPFRFYLSVSIIFFILYGLVNQFSTENLSPVQFQRDKEENTITEVDSTDLKPESEITHLDFFKRSLEKIEIYNSYSKKHPETFVHEALKDLKHENNFYNQWLYKRVLVIEEITENPTAFINYVMGKLPFVIFFFIPVFTLVLWLTYGRLNFTYMEHLVFSFHTQTMLFFMMTFGLILTSLFSTAFIRSVVILLFLFYLYKALRNFYKQKRWKTILKFVFLNVIFIILAFITTILEVIFSLVIY
ncbi:DUF3667 domain-containing protein [Mesonia maritima]|uniref:DUF3667 domain-containing protein n=1 Tax=Mesonia maritima TaxID=1793873 RepID=A0ABU1K6P3_9FLAO|nr:DUF3667 domain-containing protein [Mesonia maritima]MDR6301276.1 hypothetical protein [Mesonia maritima]